MNYTELHKGQHITETHQILKTKSLYSVSQEWELSVSHLNHSLHNYSPTVLVLGQT